MQDIKLDPETASSWEDEIQILDEGGATIETFAYATADESGLDFDGWVNGDGELAKTTLAAGQSVIVNTVNESRITFSGAVGAADTAVVAVSGFNFIGNNTPVAVNIQDIKLDANGSSWEDEIQVLDEGGATTQTFAYATADESGLEADGWINGDGELADITLEPGDGFIVNIVVDGTIITIPSAL